MICRHFSVIPDTIPQLVKCHTVLEHVAALSRTQQLEGRHSEKFNQYKQNPVSCSRDPATPQPIPKLVIVLCIGLSRSKQKQILRRQLVKIQDSYFRNWLLDSLSKL